jgi:hypothetical protein
MTILWEIAMHIVPGSETAEGFLMEAVNMTQLAFLK